MSNAMFDRILRHVIRADQTRDTLQGQGIEPENYDMGNGGVHPLRNVEDVYEFHLIVMHQNVVYR